MNKKELIHTSEYGETVEYNHEDNDYIVKSGDIELFVSAYYGYLEIKENGKKIFYMEFDGGRK